MADIDDFLARKGEAEPAPEAEAPQAEAPAPEQAAPEAEAPEAEAPEEETTTTRDGRTVPLAALEKIRAERQDHKERAARLEGELAEVRRQMEEIRKAQTAPQAPPQPPRPINPVEDPQGFVSRIQEVVLNERLNTSELLLRKEIGSEAVDKAIEEFKQAAQTDPTLFPTLYSQGDPYTWMAKKVEALRVQREMGDDPAAYRAKLEADIRARLEAEIAGQQQPAPRVSPAANLPPSLAGVRSAAPRSAPPFSGPAPLDDILGQR